MLELQAKKKRLDLDIFDYCICPKTDIDLILSSLLPLDCFDLRWFALVCDLDLDLFGVGTLTWRLSLSNFGTVIDLDICRCVHMTSLTTLLGHFCNCHWPWPFGVCLYDVIIDRPWPIGGNAIDLDHNDIVAPRAHRLYPLLFRLIFRLVSYHFVNEEDKVSINVLKLKSVKIIQ